MSFFTQIEPLVRKDRRAPTDIEPICSPTAWADSRFKVRWRIGFFDGNGNAELFNVTILVAGDCGFDTFAQPNLTGLNGLTLLSSRISIYYSANDELLNLSQLINGLQRLGQDGPKNRTNGMMFRQQLTECSTQLA